MLSRAARILPLLQRGKSSRRWLLSRLPRRATCAELGVYKGDFSHLALKMTAPKKLHLVDPWKFELDPAYADSWYGGDQGQNQTNMDDIYRSVWRRFNSEIERGVVELHRQSSADACRQFPDNYFDWIYIDGNHKYEFVKQDLEMYLPKVKPHGLIAGDDYATPGWWQDGVTKAVDEAIAGGRFEKLHIENNQFLLRKV